MLLEPSSKAVLSTFRSSFSEQSSIRNYQLIIHFLVLTPANHLIHMNSFYHWLCVWSAPSILPTPTLSCITTSSRMQIIDLM